MHTICTTCIPVYMHACKCVHARHAATRHSKYEVRNIHTSKRVNQLYTKQPIIPVRQERPNKQTRWAHHYICSPCVRKGSKAKKHEQILPWKANMQLQWTKKWITIQRWYGPSTERKLKNKQHSWLLTEQGKVWLVLATTQRETYSLVLQGVFNQLDKGERVTCKANIKYRDTQTSTICI